MNVIIGQRRNGSSLQLDLQVTLDIDLDDYAVAYGHGTSELDRFVMIEDIKMYLPQVVAVLLTTRPDHDRRPGDPLTVGAPDAGVTLTGALADEIL